jgi:serine/threonine protein kinase
MEIQERYEIRRKLGQGGVGTVHEGYDRQLKRKVAIKRLVADDSKDSKDSVEELLRECHSLSALNSPNIVSLYDFGEDGDGPFVVMELLEGETLEQIIARAPFTEQDFLILAEQSLEGIVAAHAAHLQHRDLKPENFMVTWLPSGRMQLKLLDFGLANFSIEPSKQTIARENSLFGSIHFMAPEQFEQLELDARTDLYALGAVFYYALTGQYPFDGDSVALVMAGHLTGKYKDLREFRPDMHPGLCKWVMNLMSCRATDRPDSAQTALNQFMGVLNETYDPPEPFTVSPLTQPITVKADTATSRLRIPGAAPGGLAQETGRVEHSAEEQHNNTWASLGEPRKGKDGIPKWVWLAISGIVAVLLLVVVISSISGNGRNDSSTAGSDDFQEELKLPSGKELIKILRLPDSVAALIQRRDKNKDGQLTIGEFAYAPTKELLKRLKKYFPLIDLDDDGLLSPNELNRAYFSKG